MKTTLRLAPHSILIGQNIIEVWYEGKFIGQVTGLDGSGIKFISNYEIKSNSTTDIITTIEVDLKKRINSKLTHFIT